MKDHLTVDETTLHGLTSCLTGLIEAIDINTDCMDGKIKREALEPFIEQAEDLLQVKLIGGRCEERS